jgi:CheY-like chemotaxis protein
VEDTGVGIPEEEQARIFAPFTQVRRPDGRQFDGSGLGLSIARELVERQGGSLTVRSHAGKGTCFTAVLPLPASENSPDNPQAPANAVPDLSGLRLLYVEDVASNRHVMSSILDDTGAALSFAETGADALASVKENGYDAILLDLQLPDMTGAEVARGIKAAHPELPIVAVTAQAGSAARLECEAAGMCAVVLKPVEPDQLFAVLRLHAVHRTVEPSLDEFAAIFGSKPDKFRAVIESLSTEFQSHAEALRKALAETDATAIRALRHRMHTALVQMKLAALSHDLEALTPASGGVSDDAPLHCRCLAAIQSVSEFLRRSGP